MRDEAQLYRALDLNFIPPELRENTSEFEAAENHSLPRLIEKENLRGTFHCHTVASDGHNSLEEMAAAAQELGLEYLGIAEHSKSSIQAHGIDAAKLRAQISAIRGLNRHLKGFRLFAGVECDILRDGKLDFDDEILAELDFVVASIHSVFNLSEVEMTKRVSRAMENPFVTILAHPTVFDRYSGGSRGRGRDRNVGRTECRAETARSRLALVAASERERRQVCP